MKPADVMRLKELLPTGLGSGEIRERIAREILQRSVFSARMESARYLSRLRDVCAQLSNGEINQGTAIADLGSLLEQMGHSPQDGGGLVNPASERRLKLVLDTQTQMAASVARLENQTEDTVYLTPAWELIRFESRRMPRADWRERWNAAGESVGWEGALTLRGATGDRMIALKASPIWAALGDGAGGYEDTLGNPYPPFAYGSGMDWIGIDRDECIALGLVGAVGARRLGDSLAEQSVEAGAPGESALPNVTLAPDDEELAEAAARYGFSPDDFKVEITA